MYLDMYSLKNVDCDSKWSIHDFEMGKLLGSGNYGKVYSVREKRTALGLVLALKVIKIEEIKKVSCQENIKREIEIHSRLDHPNIIKFYGIFYNSKKLYYILEHGADCLYTRMFDENDKHCLTEQLASKYAKQVTNALIYIHSQGLVHRDLKPENILISNDDNVKITDFGWAKRISDKNQDIVELNQSMAGTEAYLCPEMINDGMYDGYKVDNWCLGVLIYEMVFGQEPFQASDRIRDKFNFPRSINLHCQKLITGLLKVKPEERMELKDVVKNIWIK